jgi:hypothetical protein
MLGFRGHFLSRSRRYSTTFRELRGDGRRRRPATTLAEIDQATHTNAQVFADEVGAPLRRTLFRTRIWRPALVRAGMLGAVVEIGPREWEGQWTDHAGVKHTETSAPSPPP